MKHLDPRQMPREASAPRRKTSIARWVASLAVAIFGFGAFATWLFPASSADRVQQAERDSRQTAYTQLQAFPLVPVPAGETQAALDQMQLPPAERAALQSALPAPAAAPQPQDLRLARFEFWDTHAQDGDIVAFVSAGYRREVPLTHGAVSVTIPVDGSGVVHIVGVHDGGGGITLGLKGAGQEVLMPIMREGQTLTLPVGRKGF